MGKNAHPEAREQRAFIKRWRLDPRTRDLPACAIPNGVRTSMLQAVLAKAEGMSRGAPDWLLFKRSYPFVTRLGTVRSENGLALEFKRPDVKGKTKAKVSAEQQWWHEQLRDNGWRVEIVTSAEQAWAVVVDYLGLGA